MKIAIASGKGGTGKTLISTNLFWTVQNTNLPVTLVDCDSEEPNVAEFISGEDLYVESVFQNIPIIDSSQCVFCGKCFDYCSYNAILYLPLTRHIQFIEDLCHDCGACSMVCENGAITETQKQLGVIKHVRVSTHSKFIEARADIGIYTPVPVIKKAIRSVGDDQLIIFDSPPGTSCPFIATVEEADFVVLITEPTPFGLNDLKLSVEILQQLRKPFGVIINRAGLGNRDVYDWLQQNKISLLMEIPFDREIARIYSEGRLLTEEQPIYRQQFMELLNAIEEVRKR